MIPRLFAGEILAIALLLAGCSELSKEPFTQRGQECVLTNATIKAQADSNVKSLDYELVAASRMQAIRLEIIKDCVHAGRVPELVGGNIYCKK
jgi:PBP1b-binding outer membrane lipoprotein LpoB